MHGRLKVRTTAEQAEAKRKERQKKLEVYQRITNKVNAKRKNGELDEEALSLTAQLLIVNPDFYSLWNYRKEILEHLKNDRETTQLKELCVRELSFLESCLPVNPKSYGIWHHRSWIMLFMMEPDWKKELDLCNVYLGYDERNFHCWDYRRFVAKQAQVSADEEFKFTSNKIRENFSNYSAWHYRSKLLQKMHPDSSGMVKDEALCKEFELVQNAFYTDPNDQTAWFYHRWLLGNARNELRVLAYARYSKGHVLLYLLFNQPVKSEKLSSVQLDGLPLRAEEWFNPFKNSQPSCLWIANIFEIGSVELCITSNELNIFETLRLEQSEREMWRNCCDQIENIFSPNQIDFLPWFYETELESCELLLEEEPNNKWIILTIVLLLRAINPLGDSKKVKERLEQLREIDYYRQEYYSDLNSKYELENRIRWRFNQNEHPRKIELTDMNLSCLYHMERLFLMTDVDISRNKLRNLHNCNFLQCAEVICADDNKIDAIVRQGTLNLECLEELSLNNNNIRDNSCLKALQGCKNLHKLHLRDNPIENSPNWRQEIKIALPWLQQLNGESL